jgi:hypothetical protein
MEEKIMRAFRALVMPQRWSPPSRHLLSHSRNTTPITPEVVAALKRRRLRNLLRRRPGRQGPA